MRHIFFGVCLSCTLALSAQKQSLRQVGERLQVKKGLHVTFEQRVLTIRKKVRVTQGEGFFHPDGRFRWLIKHRGQMVRAYIYNSKTVTEYLPSEKTANVWSIDSSKTSEIGRIVTMIKAPHQLTSDYHVQEQRRTKNKLLLTLVPRERGDISNVEVVVDFTANFISNIKINYRHKRYNEFTFQNPRRKNIATEIFKFTPPTGTKVNHLQ